MELKMFNAIADAMRPELGLAYPRPTVDLLLSSVEQAAGRAGLTICDLKPLAELLGCEPEMAAIKERTQVMLSSKAAYDSSTYAAIAQALNWERTEFDTLDELLGEIREAEQARSNFVDLTIRDEERMCKVRELLCLLAETLGSTPLLDEAIELLEPRRSSDVVMGKEQHSPYNLPPVHNFRCVLHTTSGFADGGYVAEPPSGQVAAVLRPTHTLLHAGELYREVTILLHTEQLIAWRTADGQEYSAKAHRVTLDPDEDGLAAAILSRIAGVEIAPEHMAELRAQMAGGVAHG